MAKTESENKAKEPKDGNRSPGYPLIDLDDAVGKLMEFYKREGKSPALRDVAVKAWGYQALSGTALRVLSSMIQYGLLEKAGGGSVKISPLGMVIVHPKDENEKKEAIQEAAVKPTIFNELCSQFDQGMPSKESLEAEIIRNKGFTADAASKCIRVMIDSFGFAGYNDFDRMSSGGRSALDEKTPKQEDKGRQGDGSKQDRKPLEIMSELHRNFTLPLMGGDVATIQVPHPMSEENFNILTAVLSAMKSALISPPKGVSLKPSEAEPDEPGE